MNAARSIRVSVAALAALAAAGAYAQTDAQALADRWAQAYNSHDREALGEIYSEGARLMMHGSPTIAGRSSVEEFWAADMQVGDPLTLLDVTHTVRGSDMTLVHGDYRVIGREDGAQLGAGRFAHIWARGADREWRLDRDLWDQPYEPYRAGDSESDVQSLADRWTQAYNSHDEDALAALYEEDASLMMHGAPTIAGRSEIGEFWADDFGEGNPLTVLTVTHAVDGLDMVLVHGNYEVVGRDAGDRLGSGRFAHIWFQGADGEWQLDRDLWLERYEAYDF